MNIEYIKSCLRESPLTSNFYQQLRKLLLNQSFKTYDENIIMPVKDNFDDLRINLVLPELRKTGVFGGIMTALKFFLELKDGLHISSSRIIVTGPDKFNAQLTFSIKGYSHDSKENGIIFISENNKLEVRKDDIFICTHWTTAFYFYPVLNWQHRTFALKERKLVYLIQDYEPYFYPWSTEYVLAESTYHHGDSTIAVFNSSELYNYFCKKEYFFYRRLFFKPSLNVTLKKILLSATDKNILRKKRIIIYGRPFKARNAFGLIYEALKLWSSIYKDAAKWEIISLGYKFEDLKLSNNCIVALGKVSLEEYGELLLTSYAGISLMISPHPSYPPLEMSTFGVKTITNSFETKDLKSFNGNIYSLQKLTSKNICVKLIELCDEYYDTHAKIITSGTYVEGNDFARVVNATVKCLADLEGIIESTR